MYREKNFAWQASLPPVRFSLDGGAGSHARPWLEGAQPSMEEGDQCRGLVLQRSEDVEVLHVFEKDRINSYVRVFLSPLGAGLTGSVSSGRLRRRLQSGLPGSSAHRSHSCSWRFGARRRSKGFTTF